MVLTGGFPPRLIGGIMGRCPTAPQKITFADMRDMGVRGLLIYCSDYKCSHLVTISSDEWPDDLRLSRHRAEVRLLSLRQGRRRRAAGFQQASSQQKTTPGSEGALPH